jgi:hypothetical protein
MLRCRRVHAAARAGAFWLAATVAGAHSAGKSGSINGSTDSPVGSAVPNPDESRACAKWKYAWRKS